MNKFALVVTATALMTSSVFSQRGRHGGDDRVAFDNRSSAPVTVYQRTSSGSYKAYRSLAPGEAFATPALEGQVWTVATPSYYRPVEMLRVGESRGWGGNRVVVSNSDLEALGRTRLNITIANRTGRAIDLCKVVAGEELEWSSLQRSQSRSYYSYRGREWVVRDRETGEKLEAFEIGTRSGTVVVEGERPHRGGGGLWGGGRGEDRGHGHGHGHAVDDSITMVVSNRSDRAVSVLKRTRFGSRTVGTIGAKRTGRVETEPGDVWRFEDAESLAVLKTVTVPKGKSEFAVDIVSRRGSVSPPPPRPEPVRKVTLRIYNDTGERIDVFRRKGGSWKHAKRINKGRYWDVDFEPGQDISIRDPDTGRELERMRAPQGNRVIRVRGHGDHAHAEDQHGGSDHRDDHREPVVDPPPSERDPAGGLPPRPRDVLRRIFGG